MKPTMTTADIAQLAGVTKRQYRECWKQLAKVFEHGIAAGIRPADVARYLRVERATTATIASATSLVCRYSPRGHWISSNQATEISLFTSAKPRSASIGRR